VYLALYLNKDRSSLKVDRKAQLVEAIKNWHEYSGFLVDEVPSGKTHNLKNDGIAPYYFYSSLPYVTSAIKILEKDPKLSAEQKADIAKIKLSLRSELPKLIDSTGLQLLQGGKENYKKTSYVSSPSYNYPLYGLALIALLEKSDPCYAPEYENNFGIVK
jgi:hypothetical protein